MTKHKPHAIAVEGRDSSVALLGQGCSLVVVNQRFGLKDNSKTYIPRLKAVVDLFIKGWGKAAVKPTNLVYNPSMHSKSCTGDIGGIGQRFILAHIGFTLPDMIGKGIRLTQPSTRMLNLQAFGVERLTAHNTNLCIRLEGGNNSLYPPRLHNCVLIEENHDFAVGMRNPQVITTSKAPVVVALDQTNFAAKLTYKIARTIAGIVVYHNHFKRRICLCK